MAVADLVGPPEKIRPHVRDARAALEDLRMLLPPQAFDTAASGALLFACRGRGRALFGERNFLPGHTASIAIIRPK